MAATSLTASQIAFDPDEGVAAGNLQGAVVEVAADVIAEAAAREQAISDEVTARTQAIADALGGVDLSGLATTAALADEADVRQAADEALDGRLTTVESESLPQGGGEAQILAKASVADFDTEWVDAPLGASGPVSTLFGGMVPLATRQAAQVPSPFASDGVVLGGTSRIKHVMKVGATSVRLVYANMAQWDGVGAFGVPDAITVRASVELPAGTFRRVLFNGARDITIQTGGVVISDPIPVQLAAGGSFFTRTHVLVTAGLKFPLYIWTSTADGEGQEKSASPTDKTLSGTVTAGTDRAFGPTFVLGLAHASSPKSVVLVGDSIGAGQTDDGPGNLYNPAGWFGRAMLALNIPSVNMAIAGSTVASYTTLATQDTDVRQKLLPAFNTLLSALGFNNIPGGGTSLAATQALLQTLWDRAAAQGQRVVQATVTPQTTSTDGWATVVNQTSANAGREADRVALNTWIRTNPAPLYGHLDVADMIESARNSGKAKAGYLSDGSHPSAAGHAGIAALITDATLYA